MPAYQSCLIRREEIAHATMHFSFSRPDGFKFQAGQYVDLILMNPPRTDLWGNMRTLSIASAPFEDELLFAMRMTDTAFKRALATAPLGQEARLEGPAGSFSLHADPHRPAVFLAGGVGIAPFLSILRQAFHDGLEHRLVLFFSNRRLEYAAYLEELRSLEKIHPRFRFVPTVTDTASLHPKWSGEVGYISGAMLGRHLTDLKAPIYYVSGPSRFVSGMRSVLTVADVEEENIRIEDFGEY